MPTQGAPAPLRVLFIEDRDDDVVLELALLRGAGLSVEHAVVEEPDALRDALGRERFDVVISDFRLPSFSGLDALAIVREFDHELPFVLVSGTVGEQFAVDAMRAGVNDYVLKGNLMRLPAAVVREVRDAGVRREKARIEGEQRFFAEAQRLLADVGRIAGAGRDVDAIVRESARATVPLLADAVVAFVLDGGALRRVEPEGGGSDRPSTPDASAASRPDETELARRVADDPAAQALGAFELVPLRGHRELAGAFAVARRGGLAERECGALRDVATRVGLAVENLQLLADAQEGVRVRDEFLAMLGHELRNPLAPIVTALELLKLRSHEPPPRELVVIERQTRHLIRLVDDLLDIARVTRGKVELERRPIELAVAVSKALEAAAPLIEHHRHRLEVDVPAAGLVVSGDEIRLAQVVTNVLNNAARYTPDGGTIRVRACRDGGDVVLLVEDNGTGIEPDLLPHLFDRFVQGRRSIDRREGGLGLGLALVKNLVELHGGTVTARSDGPGCGSAFTIRLPAHGPPAQSATDDPATKARSSAQSAPPTGVRVLVVDDNADAAEVLAEILATEGYAVDVAHDAHDALDAAARFRPDAALLDIGLPGIDGYELATRLRASYGASLRLVAITGYGQAGDLARSKAAGFDAHLVKPVEAADLFAALASVAKS